MRRTFAVLALAGLVAAVAGSANVLDVNASTLQYGSDTTACDSNGVNVHWGLEATGGLVYNARVSDVDAGCAGADARMFVNVLGENNAVIYELEGAAENGTFRFPTPIQAETIFGAQVSIEGLGDAG